MKFNLGDTVAIKKGSILEKYFIDKKGIVTDNFFHKKEEGVKETYITTFSNKNYFDVIHFYNCKFLLIERV